MKQATFKQPISEAGDGGDAGAAEGVVVVDLTFKPIALDRGGQEILNELCERRSGIEGDLRLPQKMEEFLSTWPRAGMGSLNMGLTVGHREYRCRAFFVEPRNGDLPEPVLALHLRREASVNDAVWRVASEYHLTPREQEALIGVAMGLTSKDLAARMSISPNTVNAFLRLIMVKMNVTTRAGIVARLLEQNTPADA